MRSTLDDEIPADWKEANAVAESVDIPCIPLAPHLSISYTDDVYEPAEDTFLLIDAVCYDLSQQRNGNDKQVRVCLEIGCGSGVVLEAICRHQCQQDPTSPPMVPLTTDRNPRALHIAQHTLGIKGCGVQCDLASAIRSQSVDLMVFNPPYVPTPDEEVEDPAAWAWAGGTHGRRVVDRWMAQDLARVLKRPYGVAYIITVDENRPHAMAESSVLEQHGMVMRPIARRRAKNEYLSVQKITYVPPDE